MKYFIKGFSLLLLLNSYLSLNKKEGETFETKKDKAELDKALKHKVEREINQYENSINRILLNETLSHNNSLAHNSLQANNRFYSSDKDISFYISDQNGCSVLINDIVTFDSIPENNYVDHMILHNNADKIETIAVYSDEVNVKFFNFNKVMNIFNVYFDNQKVSRRNKKFQVEFNYKAYELIKLEKDTKSINETYNIFMWKIFNQNHNKEKEHVKIAIYFELGRDFYETNVELPLNFTKQLQGDIVKYEWEGDLLAQEVLILKVKFPLRIKGCSYLRVSWFVVVIGSVFIIFLVGMLYVIISTLFNHEI